MSPETNETPRTMLMQMLGDHVPVTLLLDLLTPPDAREVFSAEGGEADWLAGLSRTAA